MLRIFFLYSLLTILINLNYGQQPSSPTETTFTTADELKEVDIALMDTFQVRLPTQMGSGYRWSFAADVYPGFKLLNHRMEDIKPLPGGKQHQIFTFQVRQQGFNPLRLTFKSLRSQKDVRPEAFKIFFNVASPHTSILP